MLNALCLLFDFEGKESNLTLTGTEWQCSHEILIQLYQLAYHNFSFVPPTIDDITDRYNSLEAQLNKRDRILQDALHQSLDLENKLKECDTWLSQVETNVQMMDKGKVVVVKKGPMQDQINEGVVSLMIGRKNDSWLMYRKEKKKQ